MQLSQEKAIVREVKDGVAYLDMQNGASCKSCSSKAGCSSFAFFDLKSVPYLKVTDQPELKSGDHVIVGMPTNRILKATVYMYMLPLVALIVFASIGYYLFDEMGSVVAGITGLFLSLLGVKLLMKSEDFGKQFEPVLIDKVFPLNLVND